MGLSNTTFDLNKVIAEKLKNRMIVWIIEEFCRNSPLINDEIQLVKKNMSNINGKIGIQGKFKSEIELPIPFILINSNDIYQEIRAKLIQSGQIQPMSERLQICNFYSFFG